MHKTGHVFTYLLLKMLLMM